MAIPPAFQVRLDIYDINAEVVAARPAIWAALEPHFDTVWEQYRQLCIQSVPAYAERMRNLTPEYPRDLKIYMAKLFCNPFDERWVADSEERVRVEIENGQDIRSRIVEWRGILSGFTRIVGSRHRFSGAKPRP